MENSTQVKLFYLFGLQETFNNKSVYFILPLITYLLIITVNLTLIITIIQEKGLHEPMYIFLCSLCVNGLYGTAGFYPKLLLDLQSDVQVISYGGCFTQAYVIYTSVMCEISTLTVMSYDRYVAICRPLLYHTIVTSLTVRKLLLFSWCCPLFIALIALSLAVRISLCGSRIDKIFCDIPSILKHACLPITINQNLNKFVIVVNVLQILFILSAFGLRCAASAQGILRRLCIMCLRGAARVQFALCLRSAQAPFSPERPEAPFGPERPEAPFGPKRPEAPFGPERPEAPFVPERPEAPFGPERPEAPFGPELPEAPFGPELPATSSGPGLSTRVPSPGSAARVPALEVPPKWAKPEVEWGLSPSPEPPPRRNAHPGPPL
ncbi:olfactory receptor-like protein DTMT [Oncorhynchus kisutch]|uniref:olfactory receptor-like protein DTMT n=1 Tax=Oncorhynchus kisutch TaxID=8019 RepID=UPI0012DD9D81|nr:olfactory receptor-like protein DTMT [Oncorhynchus kisutch]